MGHRFVLATKPSESSGWLLGESIVALIHMQARGVSTVVRSRLSMYIRDHFEYPASKWLGYRMPEVLYTGIVTKDGLALKKTTMRVGGEGTVRQTIDQYGARHVREAVCRSTEADDETIDYRDVIDKGTTRG